MSQLSEEMRQLVKQSKITDVGEVYDLLKEGFKEILQELLETEMEETLGYQKHEISTEASNNKRNGYSSKTVKSQYGEFELDIPRDRKGEFEPQIVKKHQRDISGIEEKVIALYARGMSTRDIHDQLKDLYGIELSADMVSKMTDRILPEVKEWQNRPLAPVYSFVFLDAIHYKVRDEGRMINKAAYVALGIDLEGRKEILSINVGANESSKFWMGMLNELKNRGVQDVLFFCVDGLAGFSDAIHAAYPQAEVQRCVIHMLRNSFKYVSYKDLKQFAKDFKVVYRAATEETARFELEVLKTSGERNIPLRSRIGNRTGVMSTAFSNLMKVSEKSCTRQILLRLSTGSFER